MLDHGWTMAGSHRLEYKQTAQSPGQPLRKEVKRRDKTRDLRQFVLLPSGFFRGRLWLERVWEGPME